MKNFYSILVLTLGLLAGSPLMAQVCGGTSSAAPWPGANNRGSITPGCDSYTSTAGIGPGDYFTMPVYSGTTYQFDNCATGNWDSDVYIYDNATGTYYDYHDGDNACGWRSNGQTWTSTFTGTARVVMPQYNNCSSPYGWSSGDASTTMQVRTVSYAPAETSGSGIWNAYVFDNADFTNQVQYFTESNTAFDYGFGGDYAYFQYGQGCPVYTESFCIRMRGTFNFACGNYTFREGSDDGFRLYIDGALVIDAWAASSHVFPETTYTTDLTGGNHDIIIEYRESSGGNRLQFDWVDNGDINPPTITCPGTQTLSLNASCQASLPDYTSLATANDDCSVSVTQSPAAGTTVSGTGTTTVTLSASDGTNTTTCTFNVVRQDTTTPGLVCPGTQYISLNSSCQVSIPDYRSLATITDNCATALTISQSPAPGIISSGSGTETITITATDASGNSNSCSFSMVKQDVTNPTVSAMSNIQVCGTQSVSWTAPAFSDNCGVSLAQTAGPAPGSTFTAGTTTTITYTATDGSGNTATSSFDVIVDVIPTVSAGATQSIGCDGTTTMAANDPAPYSGSWSWTGPGAVSYLSGTSASDYNAQVGFSAAGTYTGTWTITNGTCTVSDAVTVYVNNPQEVSNLSTQTGSCTFDGTGGLKYVLDADGRVICAINANGNNLGLVNITATKNAAVPTIVASELCSSAPSSGELYMPRELDITVTNQPTGNAVDVIWYFTDAEFSAFDVATDGETSNYQYCFGDPDAHTDLMMTIEHSDATYEAKTLGGGGLAINSAAGPDDGTGNPSNEVSFSTTKFSTFRLHSALGVHGTNALPIELLYLNANAVNNDYISVSWATALEIDNSGFEVQRSTNGTDFEAIGWVEGAGNYTGKAEYQFNDHNVDAGIVYYYRLMQVDYNGDYEHTQVVSASIFKAHVFTIGEFIPNPTIASSSLTINTSQAEDVKLIVVDQIGREVLAKDLSLELGVNTITLDVSQLPAGTYTTVVYSGDESYSKRLMISDN